MVWIFLPFSLCAAETRDLSGVLVLQVPPHIATPASPLALDVIAPQEDEALLNQEWLYQSHQGDLWEKGLSVQDLTNTSRYLLDDTENRKPNPLEAPRIDTTRVIEAHLKNLPDYKGGTSQEKTTDHDNSAIRGDFFSDERSWRNPITEPVKIDEDTFVNKRDAVGAYADMVHSDNLQISVGPEFYLPSEESSTPLTSQESSQKTDVGFGMQFQWGF